LDRVVKSHSGHSHPGQVCSASGIVRSSGFPSSAGAVDSRATRGGGAHDRRGLHFGHLSSQQEAYRRSGGPCLAASARRPWWPTVPGPSAPAGTFRSP